MYIMWSDAAKWRCLRRVVALLHWRTAPFRGAVIYALGRDFLADAPALSAMFRFI